MTKPESTQTLRDRVLAQAQGALTLNTAFFGIANRLLSTLARLERATPAELAREAGRDAGYVARWCDAAYAFGLVESDDAGGLTLSELGNAFREDVPDSLMPIAVQSVLSAHMAERAASFARTGERPGEKVLEERETILEWFGPMLEASFGPFFERQILDAVPAFAEVDAKGGLAVDLGCGNGWYLRKLLHRFPHLHGLGIDGFSENIRQARELAEREGLSARLEFREGDLHDLRVERPADLVAMNRALHHVWDRGPEVFARLKDMLKPGGYAVIWEPSWPADRALLRQPGRAPMAFQNLAEHVQGNHFLRADEIAAAFQAVGLEPRVFLFAEGREAVVTGRR